MGALPRSLVIALAVSVFSTSAPDTASAQAGCWSVGCGSNNTCGSTYYAGYKNCCCSQTGCGPNNVCDSCLQYCLRTCNTSCTSCADCKKAAFAEARETFQLPPDAVNIARRHSVVAATIIEAMSENGTMPLYSQLVQGGTRLLGYQAGFAANVVAKSRSVELQILFLEDKTFGPLPDPITFRMDSAGSAFLTGLEPEVRQALEEQLLLLDMPCPPEA